MVGEGILDLKDKCHDLKWHLVPRCQHSSGRTTVFCSQDPSPDASPSWWTSMTWGIFCEVLVPKPM